MIEINFDSNQPIYLQIYEHFKGAILAGELLKGQKLPSTRFLSRDLKVGRNTVENAYAQLVSEGYVESKAGSGYKVLKISIRNEPTREIKKQMKVEQPTSELSYRYNFLYGSMVQAPFPKTTWRRALLNADAKMGNRLYTSYGHQQGEASLRNALSSYMRHYRGFSIDASQLLVCAGVEYALTLLCQIFRLKQIDTVAIEEPGYKGARDFFLHHGIKVIPIPVLKDGLDLQALVKSKAKAVYVTPSHQFPTGAVMPIHNRQALLAWAKEKDAFIIEDDYDSELRYNSRPIPSIGSTDTESRVIYIGTFSKALSPSLRVSYLGLPLGLLACYKEHFGMYQCSVPTLIQEALTDLILNGHYETHLRKVNVINKRKHNKLIQAIKLYMSDSVIIHGGQAGIHILLEVTNGMTETELIENAQKSGIILMPASPFWYQINTSTSAMVVLAFGNIEEEAIEAGVAELSRAWHII